MGRNSFIPKVKLIVIIRDASPLFFFNDAPRHRTVTVELTEEQLQKLRLEVVGVEGGKDLSEEIDRCFLEPAADPSEVKGER